MKRVIIESNGKILSEFNGDSATIALNVPSNAIYVDDVNPASMTDYWDFDLHQFVSIGDPPSSYHVFDYALKHWVDPRTLDEIKSQKWQELKKQRTQIEFDGFEFEGGLYDSDQVSQGRIMGAALAGVDQVWTLKDNSTRLLTAAQLQQLYAAMAQHVAQSHERGRIARAAIEAAQTKEEVEAVIL